MHGTKRLLPAAGALVVAGLAGFAAAGEAPRVQIVRLDDFRAKAEPTRGGDLVLGQEICIEAVQGATAYRLRIVPEHGADFALRSDVGRSLPFTVVWASGKGAEVRRDTPGEFGTFSLSREHCGMNAYKATLRVEIARDDLRAALAGDYRGALAFETLPP